MRSGDVAVIDLSSILSSCANASDVTIGVQSLGILGFIEGTDYIIPGIKDVNGINFESLMD